MSITVGDNIWKVKSFHAVGRLNRAHPDLRGCVFYQDWRSPGQHIAIPTGGFAGGQFTRPQIGGADCTFRYEPDGSWDTATRIYNKGKNTIEFGHIESRKTEAVISCVNPGTSEDSWGIGVYTGGADAVGQPPFWQGLNFYNFTACMWYVYQGNFQPPLLSLTNDAQTDQALYLRHTSQTAIEYRVRESSWSAVQTDTWSHGGVTNNGDGIFLAVMHSPTGYSLFMNDFGVERTQAETAWTESRGSSTFFNPTTSSSGFCINMRAYSGSTTPLGGIVQVRLYNRRFNFTQMRRLSQNPWAPRTQ